MRFLVKLLKLEIKYQRSRLETLLELDASLMLVLAVKCAKTAMNSIA